MIRIDMGKAKEICHEIRRIKRAEEFSPLDIKATIPMYVAEAEIEREKVRAKYVDIQLAIDASQSPGELKAVIDAIK